MGYGLAIGAGRGLQKTAENIRFEQQRALEEALRNQQMSLQLSEEQRRQQQHLQTTQQNELEMEKLRQLNAQIPINEARESIKLGMDFDPQGFINAGDTPDLLKRAGIPFQRITPEDIAAAQEAGTSDKLPQTSSTGLVVPDSIKMLMKRNSYANQPLPPEMRGAATFQSLFGANPPVERNGSENWREFVVPTSGQGPFTHPSGRMVLPAEVGASNQLPFYHPPNMAQAPVFLAGPQGFFSVPRVGDPVATPVQLPDGMGGGQMQQPPPAALKGQAVALAPLYGALDNFKMLSGSVNTEVGPAAMWNGAKRYGKALAKLDPDAQQMMAENNMFDSTLARLKGEVGVLTELDVQKARSFMPTIWDDKIQAQWKLQQLESFLTEKRLALEAMNVNTSFLPGQQPPQSGVVQNPANIGNVRPQ